MKTNKEKMIDLLDEIFSIADDKECPRCNGTGDDYDNQYHTAYPVCWNCNGSGTIKSQDDDKQD